MGSSARSRSRGRRRRAKRLRLLEQRLVEQDPRRTTWAAKVRLYLPRETLWASVVLSLRPTWPKGPVTRPCWFGEFHLCFTRESCTQFNAAIARLGVSPEVVRPLIVDVLPERAFLARFQLTHCRLRSVFLGSRDLSTLRRLTRGNTLERCYVQSPSALPAEPFRFSF